MRLCLSFPLFSKVTKATDPAVIHRLGRRAGETPCFLWLLTQWRRTGRRRVVNSSLSKQWSFHTAAILAGSGGVNTGVPHDTIQGSVSFGKSQTLVHDGSVGHAPTRSESWVYFTDYTCVQLQFPVNMAAVEKTQVGRLQRIIFEQLLNSKSRAKYDSILTVKIFFKALFFDQKLTTRLASSITCCILLLS